MRAARGVGVSVFMVIFGGGCAPHPGRPEAAAIAAKPEAREELRAEPAPVPQIPPAPAITGPRYASPYLSSGALADWAARLAAGEALGALAGDLASKATSKAIDQAASRVPYVGGLLAAGAKKAVEQKTEQAVLSAFKASLPADQWFASPCELVIWMKSTHGQRADFAGAKAAVSTLYPDVGAAWDGCSG